MKHESIASLPLLLCCVGLGCSKLPDIPRGVCGNQVLEGGEQCDGSPAPFACGAPRTPAACRFICQNDVACPAGMSCGQDEICRIPSGRFEDPRFLAALEGDQLEVTDVDHDGAADLVAISRDRLRIRYGTGDGRFDQVSTIVSKAASGPLTFEDVDVDGERDVLYPSFTGLAVLRGQGERRVGTMLSPFSTMIDSAAVPMIGAIRGNSLIDTYYVAAGEGLIFGFSDAVTYPMPEGWSTASLVGRPRVGQRTPQLAAIRQDLMIAQGEVAAVYAWDSDVLGAPSAFGLRQVLPFGGPLVDTPLFADLDGDGQKDLLGTILARDGAPAYSIAFSSTVAPPLQSRLPCPARILHPNGGVLGAPLATGLLDPDAAEDLIVPAGLAASIGAAPIGCEQALTYAFLVNARRGFRRAVVGDFNADGRRDFAAQDGDDLDIYISRDGLTFTRHAVELRGDIEHLEAGDVDGDGSTDLLVSIASSSASSLSVVYGARENPGATIAFVARMPHLDSISLGDLFGEAGASDGAADLLLTTTSSGTAQTTVSIVAGDGGRQLQSPLSLSGAGETGDSLPLTASVGRFCPSRSQRSVATLAVKGDEAYLWLASRISEITVAGPDTWRSSLLSSMQRSGLISDVRFSPFCAVWRPADLDGDGIDELVAVSFAGINPNCPAGPGLSLRFDPQSCAPIATLFDLAPSFRPLTARLSPVVTGGPPALWEASSDRLLVRAFAGDAPTRVLGEVGVPGITAMAPFSVGSTNVILAAGEASLYSIPLDSSGALGEPEAIAPLPPGQRIRAMASSDVNSDGLPDLVVLTSGNVYWYPGKER